MTKGTASKGKRNSKTHIMCRRCGNRSYHIRKKRCAHCGFGETKKMKDYNWKLHKRKLHKHRAD